MNLAYWLNTTWMWKCHLESRAYRRATGAVEQTQSTLLRTILKQNSLTLFGRKHNFGPITDVGRYRQSVPLSTFDDYSEFVEMIAAGTPNVLTRQPVELLEPTSGTVRGEKWIPYTRSLREQFQRAISAWIGDLMSQRPALRRGRAYWSVSPGFGPPRYTSAGIPIGFDDDTAYLPRLERLIAGRLLAVPPSVAKLPDVAAFRYLTLLHLLRAADLTLISVWNPTFLTVLLARLDEWHERLCHDIRRGSSIPGEPARSGLGALRPTHFPADPRRADQLQSIFKAKAALPEKLRMIWPQLALLSCWADGPAAWAAPELQDLFPGTEVQPKGLIATEAFVSLPLVGRAGAALALRSHFFEFEEDPSNGDRRDRVGTLRLAHELERGGQYRVVVTTGGGLYRYQLRDVVSVVGFENGCPLLRFQGKADCVSDLVGEKLSELHVRRVLRRAFSSGNLSPTFALVVPVQEEPPRYRLYVQGLEERHHSTTVLSLGKSLEDGLSENPYYRYAVSLGQLAPAEVRILSDEEPSAYDRYERRCIEFGQKIGDMKPTALDPRSGWADVFGRLGATGSGAIDARAGDSASIA